MSWFTDQFTSSPVHQLTILNVSEPGQALTDPLFVQSPLGIALYDAAGRVATGNAAYERHFGVRVADVPAEYSLFTDAQLEAAGLLPLIRRAYGGESVVLPPVRYDAALAADGTGRTVWTQGHCYPVRDEAGAVTHVAIVHVDVTTWATAEAALRQAGAELEERNAQLQLNAAELEISNDDLHATAAALEERTEEAENARAMADAARRRVAFLADASERLAASLDYETTIREVVALAVPAVADWAAYNVDAGDGTLHTVAIHHPDPAKEALAREIDRRYPMRADAAVGVAQVIRSGEPELIAEIPDAVLEAVSHDGEHLAMLRSIGFRSLMNVPVIANGRVIGALGFGMGESGRVFGEDDVAFAMELARRAATSIDHARLFEDAQAARHEAEAERARATGVLEAMADAYFVLDDAFRFVSVNAAMERGVGVSREGMLGRTMWEVFPGTVGTIFEMSYRRVVAERVAVHFTGDYDEDGLSIVPEVDAYPTAGGGVAVFWRDIAPHRRAAVAERAAFEAAERARADAEAAEARLRDVFEQAPVAVAVLTGPEHVYTVVSPLYAQTPGTGRQLLGRSVREAFPELEGTGYPETMDRVYETGEPYSARERQIFITRADGTGREERFFNVGYQPLRDAAGRVYAIASVAYDITEQVRARREVEGARVESERLRAVAEGANAAKSQFLSTMSHELRTPLNAIAGYTQLLTLGVRGPLTEVQRQDMERIDRASQHLMGLVTDVLNFARLDAGQIEFKVADVDLAPVVADLEPLVGPQLAAKGLAFDHDGCAPDTPDEPHLVRADAEKLRQILLNLLTNAVKFTDAGGQVSLSCETDRPAGVVRVRVSDTGRGIPADQLERVFEPFVQVDRHRTHESQQGVGLGLAISRDLARGMGGELTAESEVGVGSTFTVTLRGVERAG